MPLNAVIFDMDGLLIDSEPYWQEAGMESLLRFDVALTAAQYHSTTGLRSKEWVAYWFEHFGIDTRFAAETETAIIRSAVHKINERASAMPGVEYILTLFRKKNFRIGLATSSPVELIDVVTKKLGIRDFFDAYTSAETLPYSKPHPQVFMDCAGRLNTSPLECMCFEDSFNGMIAAKAARMKCIVVPVPAFYAEPRWGAADLKLQSLQDFNEVMFESMLNAG